MILLCMMAVHAGAQSKAKEAKRVSQSKAPENLSTKSYSPPPSRSQRPGQRVARIRNPSSDERLVLVIKTEPHGPLMPSARARYYGIGSLELGIHGGLSHGFTDVVGKPGQALFNMKSVFIDNSGYSMGAYARYHANSWFGMSGGFTYGHLSGLQPAGYDYIYGFGVDEFEVPLPLSTKVYSFKNDVYELYGRLELHTSLLKHGGLGLYGFAGLAAFYDKPVIYGEQGQVIDVAALQTDSGMYTEPAISLALPVGVGLRMMLAHFIRLGIEVGYRYTASQGLDGVYVPETRYDSYMYSGITVGYVLPSKK